MRTEFTCISKSENDWKPKRGSGLKASLTDNLWDIPTTVDISVLISNPLTLNVLYHVKSRAVIQIGDQETKMVNLFFEHLIAYLKGVFDDSSIIDQESLEKEKGIVLKCSNCNKDIIKSFTYCPYCGNTLKNICTNCGEIIESGYNLCPFCGVEILKSKID
ncbi:MAG: zinc ribbon domain-containing protein [Candidatus Heimdallarchaeota archaeon]